MKKIILVLLSSLTFSVIAENLNDIFYVHRSFASTVFPDLVAFEVGEDIRDKVAKGDYLMEISEVNSKCSMAFLDPQDNFISKKFSNVPYRSASIGVEIFKVRIMDCKVRSHFEGKVMFVAGALFDRKYRKAKYLQNSSEYHKKLDKILLKVESNKDDESFRMLLDVFRDLPFGQKVNEKIEEIETKRKKIILDIKEQYKKSVDNAESLVSLAKKVSEKKIYKDSSYYGQPVKYSDVLSKDKLMNILYKLLPEQNDILAYHLFVQAFPRNDFSKKAIVSIYKLVEKENNIAGYGWFIEQYSSSKLAIKALIPLHKLAFELAENFGTYTAYSDFVIAYPIAKQVREANARAYELEKSEYVGMLSYFSEEKDARRLLVQSKMLEQSTGELSNNEKVGYMMVVNRMNNLLKREFSSTDAALRHLESNEFKIFVKTFKSSMRDLTRQVARIADNTGDLSSLIKSQSNLMNNHFENSAQDRQMASELTKQHRFWERYIGEVGY